MLLTCRSQLFYFLLGLVISFLLRASLKDYAKCKLLFLNLKKFVFMLELFEMGVFLGITHFKLVITCCEVEHRQLVMIFFNVKSFI